MTGLETGLGAKQRGLGDRLRDGLRDCGDRLGLGLGLGLGDRFGLGQDGHSHGLTVLEYCAAAGLVHCGRIEEPKHRDFFFFPKSTGLVSK